MQPLNQYHSTIPWCPMWWPSCICHRCRGCPCQAAERRPSPHSLLRWGHFEKWGKGGGCGLTTFHSIGCGAASRRCLFVHFVWSRTLQLLLCLFAMYLVCVSVDDDVVVVVCLFVCFVCCLHACVLCCVCVCVCVCVSAHMCALTACARTHTHQCVSVCVCAPTLNPTAKASTTMRFIQLPHCADRSSTGRSMCVAA